MKSNVLDENSPEITDSFFSLTNVDSVRAERIVVNDSLRGFKDSNGDGELYHLLALSGVKMVPLTHLKSNLHFGIMTELYGDPTAYPATDLYLSSFCLNDYNASQLKSSLQMSMANKDDESARAVIESTNFIRLFPNPAHNLLTLRSSHLDMSDITIHDLSGRILKQINLPDQTRQYQMDLSGIAPGTYIVRVDCGDEVFSEKLVVTR